MTTRCAWVVPDDPLYVAYHDHEWGVPVHDDLKLFEMLCLEGQQAGLSWRTILHKRDGYRAAFAHFDPHAVAKFDAQDIERLLTNPGIVRNRLKVNAIVKNARAFLATQAAFETFDRFIWQFVGGAPIVNRWASIREVPSQTREAEAMSADLRRRGFTFVGPTICYAFMQATGLVNDHTLDCVCRQR
jgi:DNA-3-methyladenine glycosylase I